MGSEPPVPAGLYDRKYFLESCGGAEFYRAYGPKVLKPELALALRRSEVRPGMKVLDAGCGRGELLFHLHALGAETYGLDYSPHAIEIARAHVPEAKLFQTDITRIPIPKESLDRIFFVGVFEHLHPEQLRECFESFWGLLRPGGKVLIGTCTNRLYYKNWTYRARAAVARSLGLARLPQPPRSDEDRALHVNEQSLFSMRRFFRGTPWRADVELLPNFKLLADEIYGADLPAGFPLRPIRGWRRSAFLKLLFRPPLRWILARQVFCTAEKRAA